MRRSSHGNADWPSWNKAPSITVGCLIRLYNVDLTSFDRKSLLVSPGLRFLALKVRYKVRSQCHLNYVVDASQELREWHACYLEDG